MPDVGALAPPKAPPKANPVRTTPAPTATEPAETGAELLQFVDFKWLMAGEGHRIDVARLQADRAYARGCLALARASTCAPLREAAERLGRRLEIVVPRA